MERLAGCYSSHPLFKPSQAQSTHLPANAANAPYPSPPTGAHISYFHSPNEVFSSSSSDGGIAFMYSIFCLLLHPLSPPPHRSAMLYGLLKLDFLSPSQDHTNFMACAIPQWHITSFHLHVICHEAIGGMKGYKDQECCCSNSDGGGLQ